jgi:CRISPR/Cas system CMR subunit Cmr6 (Cas7 group RAMP superfamily)
MPADTAAILGQNAEKCDSRSLLLERLVYDHPEMNEARKLHFAQVCGDSFAAIKATRSAWEKQVQEFREKEQRERDQRKLQQLREAREKLEGFLADTVGLGNRQAVVGPVESKRSTAHWLFIQSLGVENILHAQLQSHLMVNMAGGVMENAGLCLDRFGLPYIPGSAVKGCARRAALAALHEWCEAGGKPEHKPTGADNPLAPCCAAFTTPAEMLAAIARIFGWCEQDWSDQSNQSDFLWACGPNHRELWQTVAQALANHFGWTIADRHAQTPWKSLPNFAGSVSFLPAYPVDLGKTGKVDGLPLEVPPLGKLELDVVTCHHPDYYAGKLPIATDTEEPVPVVFPAVAPGHVFAFAIVPLRGADPQLVQHGRTWLATGLSAFGLGAKTNAGYGWFDCSATIHNTVQKTLHDRAERERAEKQRLAEEQRRKAEVAERLRQEQEREAALANLSGDERADKEIELLTEQQFDAKVRAFCKEPRKGGPTEEQKKAIVRALRGPRLAYWQAFKAKATKGELAKVVQAVRELCKAMNLGKMP